MERQWPEQYDQHQINFLSRAFDYVIDLKHDNTDGITEMKSSLASAPPLAS